MISAGVWLLRLPGSRTGFTGLTGDLALCADYYAHHRAKILFILSILSKLARAVSRNAVVTICLLYTSDAADERSSVDLGGRRIIKKKK